MEERLKRVWVQEGETYWLRTFGVSHDRLPNEVFTLCVDGFGNKYLKKECERFTFDYKIYGLERGFIDRVVKSYHSTQGNMGMLLNGLRGTGKTVTAKLICNALDLPVIIVDNGEIEGGHLYLNSIPQDIVIFVDEYEKVYSEDYELLTIMDGALNSEHRRFFALTTNTLYVNENLLQRPGRIRYLKAFKDLSIPVIEEIVDDCLQHKKFREDVVRFVSTLEMITVDIVKTICQEVDIHDESPEKFADVFNVKKISGKYDIFLVDEETGSQSSATPLFAGVKVRPNREFEEGYSFSINNEYIGEIVDVADDRVIKVHICTEGLNKYQAQLLGIVARKVRPVPLDTVPGAKNPSRIKGRKGGKKEAVDQNQRVDEFVTILVSDSETYHRSFRHWPVL